jgi:hypothetical protein
MNKVFLAALALSTALSGSAAFAGQNDDLVARLNAAEQENAAIRRTNLELAAAKPAKPASITDRMADFFGAYAADLPVAYKAPPPVEPGRFTAWVEGGAIWTGGDSVFRDFSLNDFTTVGFSGGIQVVTRPLAGPLSLIGGGIPGIFDLNPKVGWEVATGFDYKFAGSPWHVSGQVRYGQGGNASGSAATSGILDPTLLALINSRTIGCFSPIAGDNFPVVPNGPTSTACGGSETFAESYKETHWLADLALGYDIAGHGPSAMQVKGGLRIEEFVARTTTSFTATNFVNYSAPVIFTGSTATFSSFNTTSIETTSTRDSFLGAGPLIGLEGSAPLAGAWSFDYKGDLAVLFGTQNSVFTDRMVTTNSTPLLCVNNISFCPSNFARVSTDARFATMLSGDIQAGVSYWFTPNLKLGVSYRIDALIAVKNQKSADADDLVLPQRYWHGPRVTLTGQF